MTFIGICFIVLYMSKKRILFCNGTYHVYNRGHNKMGIFRNTKDKEVFLNIIRRVQLIYNFQLFAYCIMGNHYHLLIKDAGKQLPEIIGLIQEIYAIYYNAKYNHSGAVFMRPFKSKPVYTMGHFFSVLSYILNNPVKAGFSYEYCEYKWNSPLTGYEKYNLTDYLYINTYYKPIAGLSLHEYILKRSASKLISDLEIEPLSDKDAKKLFNYIVKDISGYNHFSLDIMTKDTQEKIIAEAQYQGVNTRQIAKFTNLSQSSVYRMKSRKSYIQ